MLSTHFYSILEFSQCTDYSFDIFRNMTGIFFLVQQFSGKLCHIVCARYPAFQGMKLPTGSVDPSFGGQSCELECDKGVRSSFGREFLCGTAHIVRLFI